MDVYGSTSDALDGAYDLFLPYRSRQLRHPLLVGRLHDRRIPSVPYSASATGGNAFARYFLAGISAMYAALLYRNLSDKRLLEYATTMLAASLCLVAVPIYMFYWKALRLGK
jgi:hypothetical protein